MVNSASGLLALLEEEDVELKTYALQQLSNQVDIFWSEIADSASRLDLYSEVLYEDKDFPAKELAALVASKVYYHLGDLDEALTFALGAGKLFDVSSHDQYVETIISQCIDQYVQAQSTPEKTTGDPRLKQIVERMFQRCIEDKEYKQALGIALESKRLDMIKRILEVANDSSLLAYILDAVMSIVTSLDLRNEVLRLLVKLFGSQSQPDYFSISKCYAHLNDSDATSQLLLNLVSPTNASNQKQKEDSGLIAFQIAFDLTESVTQEFLENVMKNLQKSSGVTEESSEFKGDNEMKTDEGKDQEPVNYEISQLLKILTGEVSIKMYLEFLSRNNHADLLILKNTKEALDARSSLYNSAVTFANAFANAGTTSDKFLQENLDWLGKASNWSKFSATAALGVIHKGNLEQGLNILKPYLPPESGASNSIYSEGGSLFGLGLIHTNSGSGVLEYLRKALKSSTNEVVQHGAALGLGVAGMATGSEEIYDELREVLFMDSAVAGEAAGYAMGLVMLGTGSAKALEEMLQYAHETQHEKIIRGLAVGISFLVYGLQEKADAIVETLTSDKDPVLRYGGIHALALAHAGTGNNAAIRRLLHVAVSDVNDDVRRAAVTALGFILFRNPSQVPRIVQLLSESYNPNVRYGAALALGISCAGTGLEEAIDLLEPMCKDPVDFVRQGACISLAMILLQQNETLNPRVSSVRKIFEKIISDKHEDPMAKMGGALAQGIIDAGGRNVTISLQNRSGSSNMSAIVGMALFTQFWYWFPLAHCASMAFAPTAIIGIDKSLKIPKFEFESNLRPSIFAYPPPTKPPQKETVEKVATAVLSTTAKATARQEKKDKEKAAQDTMETDDQDTAKSSQESKEAKEGEVHVTESKEKETEDKMEIENIEKSEGKTAETTEGGNEVVPPKTKRRKEEPTSQSLPNLSRVVPAQLPHINFPSEGRFHPVRPLITSTIVSSSTSDQLSTAPANSASAILTTLATTSRVTGGGIILLRDSEPEKEVEYFEYEANKNVTSTDTNAIATEPTTIDEPRIDSTGPIAPMPPAFEYNDWE